MSEAFASNEPDLRAGRFVASLRRARGLSPEQMGKLSGVGGSTIRDIEEKGRYPHLDTQDRIAAFVGLAKEQIWRDPRKPIARRRVPSKKALSAIEQAALDPSALLALSALPSDTSFAFGIAWAVIRGQSPYAPSQAVTDRALVALEEWHGSRSPAQLGA